MKKRLAKKNVFLVLFCVSFMAYSQGKAPPQPMMARGGMNPGGGGGGLHPELPIDGGLSFLLIAGTAYGAYELRKKKK